MNLGNGERWWDYHRPPSQTAVGWTHSWLISGMGDPLSFLSPRPRFYTVLYCWKEWFNKSTHHLSVQLPRLSHHHDIANRIPTFHPPPPHRLLPLQNDSLRRLRPHHRPLQTPHRHQGRRLFIRHRNRRPEPVSVQLHGTHRNPIPFQPNRSLTRYI